MKDEEKKENLSAGADEEIVIEDDVDGSADALKKLREKLKKCEADKVEYLTGWQRAKADFVNARREEEERRRELAKFSEKNLILDFLNLADSFDRLFANKEGWDKVDKNWRQGMEYLHAQLSGILKSRGVEAMESEGKPFDPREHESIGEVSVDKKENDGIVMEEMRKGYKMHNAVIRPSLVKVGKIINKESRG